MRSWLLLSAPLLASVTLAFACNTVDPDECWSNTSGGLGGAGMVPLGTGDSAGSNGRSPPLHPLTAGTPANPCVSSGSDTSQPGGTPGTGTTVSPGAGSSPPSLTCPTLSPWCVPVEPAPSSCDTSGAPSATEDAGIYTGADAGDICGSGIELGTYIRCLGLTPAVCEDRCFAIQAYCVYGAQHPKKANGGIGNLKQCMRNTLGYTCTYCYPSNGDVCTFIYPGGWSLCSYTGGKGCE